MSRTLVIATSMPDYYQHIELDDEGIVVKAYIRKYTNYAEEFEDKASTARELIEDPLFEGSVIQTLVPEELDDYEYLLSFEFDDGTVFNVMRGDKLLRWYRV